MTAPDPHPTRTQADPQPTPIVWAQPATYDSAYDDQARLHYPEPFKEQSR